MTDPKYLDDEMAVTFSTTINEHPIIIAVPRELIEDTLRAEDVEAPGLVEFVRRNRNQIVENVRAILQGANDVDRINVGYEQLRHCR